jgi:hypothetical protein
MTTFEEREKAFEAKYKLDQEAQFKINVRRDKLLGLWVAEQLGLSGSEAQAYARTVIEADFAVPGDSDVIAKVLKDLKARGVVLAEDKLVKEMDRLADLARQQILAEIKT